MTKKSTPKIHTQRPDQPIREISITIAFQDIAGIAGAVLIATGLVGGGLAGVYVDKTKKFEETAKISYGLAAISCCLITIVSKTFSLTLT